MMHRSAGGVTTDANIMQDRELSSSAGLKNQYVPLHCVIDMTRKGHKDPM